MAYQGNFFRIWLNHMPLENGIPIFYNTLFSWRAFATRATTLFSTNLTLTNSILKLLYFGLDRNIKKERVANALQQPRANAR
jgi:hypothetical protein